MSLKEKSNRTLKLLERLLQKVVGNGLWQKEEERFLHLERFYVGP